MTKTCTLPRGIRLNNPGNIKESPGDKTQWHGERATDDDPVFEEFVSPEVGIRALARILLGYQRRHGLNTVAGIINRWAPGCENDTGAYIAHVASRLGVAPDQAIDVTRPETMADPVDAIIRHENGQQPYAREVILAGVDMGLAKVALDVAPDIASLFGDDAEKTVGKLADSVRAITGTDDPDKAREALADPTLVLKLRSQAQGFAHAERMQQMTGAITTLTATLADHQNARARDSEFIKAGRSNTRANVLLVTAGLGGSADSEQTRTLLAQAPPIGR